MTLKGLKKHHNTVVFISLLLPSLYYIYKYNIWEHATALPFTYFKYPLEIDLKEIVNAAMREEDIAIEPVYAENFPIILDNDKKCKNEDGEFDMNFLLFIIKSKITNFKRREAIRRTWAQQYLMPYSSTHRIFVVGVVSQTSIQQKLAKEHELNQDIVQAYFPDDTGNDTHKLTTGLKWAIQNCKGSRYIVYVSDDYFVSTFNLIHFLNDIPMAKYTDLYLGFVRDNYVPVRNKEDNYYVSLQDYPFRFWPPLAKDASFVASPIVAEKLYIGMQYTKYLPFDEAMLGVVSWKLQYKIQHHKYMTFDANDDNIFRYHQKTVLTGRGFYSPDLLYFRWKEHIAYRQRHRLP